MSTVRWRAIEPGFAPVRFVKPWSTMRCLHSSEDGFRFLTLHLSTNEEFSDINYTLFQNSKTKEQLRVISGSITGLRNANSEKAGNLVYQQGTGFEFEVVFADKQAAADWLNKLVEGKLSADDLKIATAETDKKYPHVGPRDWMGTKSRKIA